LISQINCFSSGEPAENCMEVCNDSGVHGLVGRNGSQMGNGNTLLSGESVTDHGVSSTCIVVRRLRRNKKGEP